MKENKLETISNLFENSTISYYNNLLGIEVGIINDYVEGNKKKEFKKLFPTYESYKECILNM